MDAEKSTLSIVSQRWGITGNGRKEIKNAFSMIVPTTIKRSKLSIITSAIFPIGSYPEEFAWLDFELGPVSGDISGTFFESVNSELYNKMVQIVINAVKFSQRIFFIFKFTYKGKGVTLNNRIDRNPTVFEHLLSADEAKGNKQSENLEFMFSSIKESKELAIEEIDQNNFGGMDGIYLRLLDRDWRLYGGWKNKRNLPGFDKKIEYFYISKTGKWVCGEKSNGEWVTPNDC